MTERDRWRGLSGEEARRRLAAEGPNTLPEGRRRTPLAVVADVVREPMFLLLLAASALYFVIGDVHEALILASSVVVIVVISTVQQGRTERALAALKDLTSPRARVLRDGAVLTVPARDLVRGDVISLGEGDRVPADALFREGTASLVDESLLTGEAASVAKVPSATADHLEAPGGDGGSSLFSGTLIVSGRCVAEVVHTGARTEIGKLGKSLESIDAADTPLQKEVSLIVRRAATFAVLSCVALVLLKGLGDGAWVDAVLAGLTLAIAILPEEFPVVLTVFLALGAFRMSKVGVLTRRVTAIETLGEVDVLCTDKTGTLTENRMTIRWLSTGSAEYQAPEHGPAELPEDVHALVEYGVLACPRDPFDPMEKAFHAIGRGALSGTEHLHPKWNAVREYPLRPDLLAVAHVWESGERERLVVAAKGAPEAVFDLCHLSPEIAERWRGRVGALATRGMRVLGVARSTLGDREVPGELHDIPFEMVGIVGFEDPLRPEVADSVALCRRAGIRVLMITGDHVETARAIAEAAGLEDGAVLTGAEIEAMGDEELADRLGATEVVARAVPAHKLRIVQALRARGLVVGMTGDGVNDAPALKSADVGIAMGARGTDVAREASALVLENDSFSVIVAAVRAGRRIHENLQRAFGYIVAVHVPTVGLSFLPALFGWPAILQPVHVALLELIIDPACSIVFELEPAATDVMDRPPRKKDARLFGARRLLRAVVAGLLVLGGILWSVASAQVVAAPIETLRSLAFAGLIAGNLVLILVERTEGDPLSSLVRARNPALPVLLGVVAASMGLLFGVAPVRELLGLGAFSGAALGTVLLAATLPVLFIVSVARRIAR